MEPKPGLEQDPNTRPLLGSASDKVNCAGMSNFSLFRLLRLLRLSRMIRLMKNFPELVTLMRGIARATRSVFSTLVLLVISLYIYAIIFSQYVGKQPGKYDDWGNILKCMYILFLGGSLLDDITDVVTPTLWEENIVFFWVFCTFVLLTNFTIINMLIGILCEIIESVVQDEGEKSLVQGTKEKLEEIMKVVDNDGNGTICEDDFLRMMDDPRVLKAFSAIGVLPKHLPALAGVLFEDEEKAGAPRDMLRWH